ncbi:plb1 [Candida pseudojiufengensis]|uniref:plb1 n=1 Tax=Candida pseudojiufengensis TaxID=497109 RepID=UPI002224A34B|nr:plb1 [Candida pseudojiufengensis]KAI5961613.1 plb1 [Candida pseudojiufengensis]
MRYIRILLQFYILSLVVAVWPFDSEENTVGATPTSPWWQGLFGGGSTSSSQSSASSAATTVAPATTSVQASSTSSAPWYANLFGTAKSSLAIATQAPTSTNSKANSVFSEISNTLLSINSTIASITSAASSNAQSTTSTISSSKTTSENVIESFIGGFFGGGSSSTRSSNSTSQTTDETESNSDGDGVSNPYSPVNVTCPNHSLIREANGLSDNEKNYIKAKHEQTNKFLISFLNNRANLTDFDAEKFINDNSQKHNISIGLAFSGGGYRAMLAGAGNILALDGRFEDSNTNALGGLLQSSTYLAGLSGGSWLVGSLVLNNWISVENILNGSAEIWDLEDSFLNPSSLNLAELGKYYTGVGTALVAKNQAGFETSITDLWGRALSHQFFNDNSGGSNVTWSSVRNLTTFKDHSMPYSFLVANGKTVEQATIIDQNSTFIVEISPYELGNFDSINAFADTEYLGSTIEDGKASQCVRNFDNAGFVMGTSSSLFNQIFTHLGDYDVSTILRPILEMAVSDASDDKTDVAIYHPNPFLDLSTAQIDDIVDNSTLSLVDGGEDKQNVPFYPLIQQDRDVDIIFAFDNSGDTETNWPNGTSFVETYKWQFTDQGKGKPFPFVPTVDTYLQDQLGEKPLFFGCNSSALSPIIDWHDENLNETDVPLVVYLSNNHQSYLSNFSTFKLSFDNAEKTGTIQNGYEVMSRGNTTEDEDWIKCVGCAIIRRQQERLGEKQSEECSKCFEEYCWTGTIEEGPEVSAFPNKKYHNSTTSSTSISNSTSSSTSTNRNSTSSTTSTNRNSTSGRTTVDAASMTGSDTRTITTSQTSISSATATSISSTTATTTAGSTFSGIGSFISSPSISILILSYIISLI